MIATEPIAPPEPRGPAVLSPGTLAAVCAMPDSSLVLWAASSVTGRDVLSDRERSHAAKILAGADDAFAAARYIRWQLATGDHVQCRARLEMTPGAVLTLGGRRYTVTGRRGALRSIVVMRGERGGLAELCEPHAGAGRWCLYLGGVGGRHAKCHTYRRDDADGTFIRVP